MKVRVMSGALVVPGAGSPRAPRRTSALRLGSSPSVTPPARGADRAEPVYLEASRQVWSGVHVSIHTTAGSDGHDAGHCLRGEHRQAIPDRPRAVSRGG